MGEREPGDYRCYVVEHKGVYLGAISIVWATTEALAREDALRLMRESKLLEVIYTITAIPPGENRVVWNGDY